MTKIFQKVSKLKLGNGASGRVYLSYNNELGIIAAKVMRLEKFDQREWDAAEFQCPFIMKYLLAKQFETDTVILMEYANAKSLDLIVKNKTKNLSSGAYRALSKQILEGMRLVHAAGLIHRDIKAENIMMHSSNGSIKVKIADFGLAKVISEAQMAVTALGTPFNMAPELLLGTSPGNNKVDMWSVGVVLFQLATHEYPIKANSLPDLQKKMKMQRIEQFTLIQDDLQCDLLTKLLEFDPSKRISAELALQHPYFTSLQAQIEVSIEARQIALNAAISFQNGEKQITKYDLDQTFSAATSEIMPFLNMNPETEQQKIVTIRSNQQDQQPIQITPQILQSDLSISGFVNNNSEQQLGISILSPPKPNIQFHSDIQNPQIQQVQQFPPPQQIQPQITPPNQQINTALPNPNITLPPKPSVLPQIPPAIEKSKSLTNTNEPKTQTQTPQKQINSTNQQQQQFNQLQSKVKEKIQEDDNAEMAQIECDICKQKIPFSKYQQHIDEHIAFRQKLREEQKKKEEEERKQKEQEKQRKIDELKIKQEQEEKQRKEYQKKQEQEDEATRILIEKMQREEQEQEEQNTIRNLRREEQDRKAAVKLQQEEQQILIQLEAQLSKQGKIICPFCQTPILVQETSNHIHSTHPDNEQIYLDVENLSQQITYHKIIQLTKKLIIKGKQVLCPYCKRQYDISEFSNHINTQHNQQQYQFNLLYHNIELTLKLKREQQQVQLNKEGKVLCPFCNVNRVPSLIQNHIHSSHIEIEEFYNKIYEITEITVKNQQTNNRGQQSIKLDVSITCPFCNKQQIFSQIGNHLSLFHNEQSKELFSSLYHNNYITMQLIKEEDEQKRKALEEELRRNEEEKDGIFQKEMERKIENGEMREQRMTREINEYGKYEHNNKQSLITCPFCEQQMRSQQINDHIKTHNQQQQQLYKNTSDLFPYLDLKSDGEYKNKDLKELQCPFCYFKCRFIDHHIKQTHDKEHPLFRRLLQHHQLVNRIQQNNQQQNKQGKDQKEDKDQIQCSICSHNYSPENIIEHIQSHDNGQQLIKDIQIIIIASQVGTSNKLIKCLFCTVSFSSTTMIKHISDQHPDYFDLFNIVINHVKQQSQQQSSLSSSQLGSSSSQSTLSSSSQQNPYQQNRKLISSQQQLQKQQYITSLKEQNQLTLIKPADITPNHFKFSQIASISLQQNNIIKLKNNDNTIVLFDQEISSGIWEFTVKGNQIRTVGTGIGIIDARQIEIPHPFYIRSSNNNNSICYIGKNVWIKGIGKICSDSKEIKSGDQVRAIADLESDPHTFSIRINNEIQPFCVTHIPDRLTFGTMNDEWEFISLKELDKSLDLSEIDGRKIYKYL